MKTQFISALLAVSLLMPTLPVFSAGNETDGGQTEFESRETVQTDAEAIAEPTDIPAAAEDDIAADELGSGDITAEPTEEPYADISLADEESTVTWSLSQDGVLTISGEGAITDTGWDKASVKKLVISEGVTVIPDNAFRGCEALTDINMPESLTSIGDYAFDRCISLPVIRIPKNVTHMGRSAFGSCYNVERIEWNAVKYEENINNYTFFAAGRDTDGVEVIFADGTEIIPAYIFGTGWYNDAKLTRVTIPSSVKSIGYGAFYGQSGLTEINIPDGVETIGSSAFYNCSSLKKVTIGASVNSVGDTAFHECPELKSIGPKGGGYDIEYAWTGDSLQKNLFKGMKYVTKIELPNDMTVVQDDMFRGCEALTEISLPDSLTSIGDYAFDRCISLPVIRIPKNVTHMGRSAFGSCYNVERIEWNAVKYEENINNYTFFAAGRDTDGVEVIFADGTEIIPAYIFGTGWYNDAKLTRVTIPSSVKSIGYGAFYGQNSVKLLVEPDSFAEQYAIDNNIEYGLIIGANNIYLNIKKPDGTGITDGFDVNWYEKGSQTIIGRGGVLHSAEQGKEYEYEIILKEALCFDYNTPARGTAVIGDHCEVTLEALDSVTVSGSVTDENGAVPTAAIRVTQLMGDYTRNIDASLNNGAFTFTAPNVPTAVYITSDGYYTASKAAIPASNKLGSINLGKIVLKKLPENRLKLSLYERAAAVENADSSRTEIVSFDGISFKLTDTTGGFEITEYTPQYPYIVLDDDRVKEGDRIQIAASSSSRKDASASAVLNGERTGTAEMEFLGNGKFYASNITADNGLYALVFDGSGVLVKRYAPAENSFYSDSMPDGEYSVVFLEKNTMLRSISSIGKLAEYGLNENKDYILRKVNINAGSIVRVGDFALPALDLSHLYYTVDSATSVSANKTEAVLGNIVTVRAEYATDGRHDISGEEILVDLPDGVDVIEGSVTVDGKPVDYTLDGGTMSVKTDKDKATVRFYVSAYQAGEYDINVSLGMNVGSDSLAQPIGVAHFKATSLTMDIDGVTASKQVTVKGKALNGSKVTLYDGADEVGTVTASAFGSWQLTFELVNAYKYSYHVIYAKVNNEYMSDLTSEYYIVKYDPDLAQVVKVTMINTAHPPGNATPQEYETVFDFQNPDSTVDSYRYWPNYPEFTFEVELDKDVSEDSEVVVEVYTEDGSIVELPAKKDKNTGYWVASGSFRSGSRPTNVGVSISEETGFPSMSASDFNEAFEDVLEETLQQVEYGEVADPLDPENGTYVSGDDEVHYKVEREITDEKPDEDTHLRVPLDDGEMYLGAEEENGTIKAEVYADPETAERMPELFPQNEYDQRFSDIERDHYVGMSTTITEGLGNVAHAESPGGVADAIFGIIDGLISNELEARDARTSACLMMRIEEFEKNGDSEIVGLVDLRRVMDRTKEMRELFNEVEDALGSDISFTGTAQERAARNILRRAIQIGKEIGCDMNKISVRENLMSLEGNSDLKNCPDGCGCRSTAREYGESPYSCCIDCGKRRQQPSGRDKTIIDDPSGYVYEAVPSNRVEGVKAEAYYLEKVLDKFGEPTGEEKESLWNAEDYDQKNPVYTDPGGAYAWDVPTGKWKVKFSKEGYYDTDSSKDAAAVDGYLPVPPPQTEVNTAIVSKADPEVKLVNIYTDRIEITFTQYMRLDSVNNSNVSVTANGGRVNGTVAPMNAEYNYEGTEQFASVFAFTPDNEISGSASVSVKNAVNYAGNTMREPYSETGTAQIRPESIDSAGSMNIDCNGNWTISVQVLPVQAGANKKINVASSSPSIVSVTQESVMTDENGTANISIRGNLPGFGVIMLSLDGTNIGRNIEINVGDLDGDVTIPVEVGGAVKGNTIIAAAYDAAGALTGVATQIATGEEKEIINLECPARTKKIKIMEWDSLTGMKPVNQQ